MRPLRSCAYVIRAVNGYEARSIDGKADRVVMDAQLRGDGPHLPVLTEEQPPHPGAQIFGDHRATSPIRSRSRS
jgi:hypothetical protein